MEGVTFIITGPTRYTRANSTIQPVWSIATPEVYCNKRFDVCSGIGKETAASLLRRKANGAFSTFTSCSPFLPQLQQCVLMSCFVFQLFWPVEARLGESALGLHWKKMQDNMATASLRLKSCCLILLPCSPSETLHSSGTNGKRLCIPSSTIMVCTSGFWCHPFRFLHIESMAHAYTEHSPEHWPSQVSVKPA